MQEMGEKFKAPKKIQNKAAKRQERCVACIQVYKFISKNLINLAMAWLNVIMIGLYARALLESWNYRYFIGRALVNEVIEEDFEVLVVDKIKYFLYLNSSVYAVDAVDANNQDILSDVESLCLPKQMRDLGAEYHMPEFFEDPQDLVRIRSNISSYFVKASEVGIMLLMAGLTVLNTFYVNSRMKGYQIPVLFRGAETNEWYDRMRIHNLLFFSICVLGGCLPNLAFFTFGEICLNTMDPDLMPVEVSDKYQYLVVVLLWVIILPTICMGVGTVFRDHSRLVCYPVLIANLIFGFLVIVMAIVIIEVEL